MNASTAAARSGSSLNLRVGRLAKSAASTVNESIPEPGIAATARTKARRASSENGRVQSKLAASVGGVSALGSTRAPPPGRRQVGRQLAYLDRQPEVEQRLHLPTRQTKHLSLQITRFAG